MQLHRYFKTANGYCHILLDKVVLSSTINPFDNNLSQQKGSKLLFIRKLVYIFILIVLTVTAIKAFHVKNYYWATICLVFGILALNYLYKLFDSTNHHVIERSAITKVYYYPSIYGVQQAHFVIHFNTEQGYSTKKIIRLTNNYAPDTAAEIKEAITIMDEEFG
jgi:hypothetical protein